MEFWTGGAGLSKIRAMPSSLATGYQMFVEDAKLAEQQGFDAYGAPEHHFMYDGFIPLPLQALAAVACATSKIRLLTGAMLLSLYDPIEAAEYAATLDVISNGRVTLGFGMGYRPMEFDGLNTPKRTRGVRLVEEMQIVDLATSQDTFSYEGKHYQYDNVRLSPTPVQRPIPMWFCGGTSSAAARRSGTAGLRYWLANSSFDRIELMVKEYRAAGREAGWSEERLAVAAFKDICIGSTVEEAQGLRKILIDTFYEEHILGYGYLVDDEGNHVYNPPHEHPMYQRFVNAIFCGTAEMVIEELKKYEALGVEAVFMASPQREIIRQQIFPEFKRGD